MFSLYRKMYSTEDNQEKSKTKEKENLNFSHIFKKYIKFCLFRYFSFNFKNKYVYFLKVIKTLRLLKNINVFLQYETQ